MSLPDTNEIRKIEKPWGFEEILETNKLYTVKRLFMKNGHQCSFQYHKKKKETVFGLSGLLTIIYEDGEMILSPGESATIEPLQKHRMAAKSSDCFYLECSTSELDDVVRISDDYDRE